VSASSTFPSTTPDPPTCHSRCTVESCRKRLGLTGFTCKCGSSFCGTHRQPEDHSCGFDHKGHGRIRIASENPTVTGSKLNKI
jgi:predicted nucleic acid binding AN1-type Zn finger protein